MNAKRIASRGSFIIDIHKGRGFTPFSIVISSILNYYLRIFIRNNNYKKLVSVFQNILFPIFIFPVVFQVIPLQH
jgi:hypothetical protein